MSDRAYLKTVAERIGYAIGQPVYVNYGSKGTHYYLVIAGNEGRAKRLGATASEALCSLEGIEAGLSMAKQYGAK